MKSKNNEILDPNLNRKTVGKEIWQSRELYFFILPGVIYFLLIKYFPVYFIQVAFRNYKISLPVSKASWAGLTYFVQLFNSRDFLNAVKNTIVINFYNLIFGFPAPIILALMLNEVRHTVFKRVSQTLVYLPHFVSWVVIGGILRNFMSVQGGLINVLIGYFGAKPINFLGEVNLFRGILVVSGIWKEVGWGTIIYLATMSGIDPQLYESATIDGANRFQQMLHITIPSILYVIVVMVIIRLGNLLNTGFEQIIMLYNPLVNDKGLVLQYFVWFNGLVSYRYSFAAAAGLFNTFIAFIMVFSADRFAKSIGQGGVF
jgi:putative aldouronate transport system permease protein